MNLNKLVAEALGHTVIRDRSANLVLDSLIPEPLPLYTTDLVACAELLKELHTNQVSVYWDDFGNRWVGSNQHFTIYSKNFGELVCRTFLAWKEVDYDDN